MSYFRASDGKREVDFLVQRGSRLVAVEVKLARVVGDADVRHLVWLEDKLGPALAEALTVTTGPDAYRRRSDGVLVVPAALFGP